MVGFTCHTDALKFEAAWQRPNKARQLKYHRDVKKYISSGYQRTFVHRLKAAFYMCRTKLWNDKNIKLQIEYLPKRHKNTWEELQKDPHTRIIDIEKVEKEMRKRVKLDKQQSSLKNFFVVKH